MFAGVLVIESVGSNTLFTRNKNTESPSRSQSRSRMKCAVKTLDRDCDPLICDPTAEVDRDLDSSPNPEKVFRVNAPRIAITIEIL